MLSPGPAPLAAACEGFVCQSPQEFLAELVGALPGGPLAVGVGLVMLLAVGLGMRWFVDGFLRVPPGMAGALELRRVMSARAARQSVAKTRPGLSGQQRRLAPPEYSYRIGRCRSPWFMVRGSFDDSALIVGPPGAAKTVWLDNVLADHPGPVVHTSSKGKDLLATADLRALIGPVEIFAPERGSAVASTLHWSPLTGCQDEKTAIERAGYLLYGARKSGDSSTLDDFFKSTACEVLRAFLHAAALSGRTMADVYRWALDAENTEAQQLLDKHGANPGWIATLEARQAVTERTRDGIFTTLSTALSWMADPNVAAAVTPPPGKQFDANAFLRTQGTLYLVGEDRPVGSSIAPLFTCLTAYLIDAVKHLASTASHHRLDPPLLLALDEVANICPVPLDNWITTLRDLGVVPIAAIQSRSQLESRWGRAGAKTIWSSAAYTLVLPGIKDREDLADLAAICGERAHRRYSTSRGPQGLTRSVHTEMVPVLPPAAIRQLKRWRMLVIYRSASPVIVTVSRLWRRRDIRQRRRAAKPLPPVLTLSQDVA